MAVTKFFDVKNPTATDETALPLYQIEYLVLVRVQFYKFLNKSNTECGIIRPTNAIYMGSNSLLGSKALSKCEVNPTSGFQDIAFTSNKLLWRPSWFS